MLLVYSNKGFDSETKVQVELRKVSLCNLLCPSGSENTGVFSVAELHRDIILTPVTYVSSLKPKYSNVITSQPTYIQAVQQHRKKKSKTLMKGTLSVFCHF